jgi:hypothetical protein
MKFVTKNLPHCALTIGYKDKNIEEVVNAKYLGLHLDNHLNWNNNIDQIIPQISAACYTVREMYHQSKHSQVNLLRLFSLYCQEWNNFLG